jgi:hypothetical protein
VTASAVMPGKAKTTSFLKSHGLVVAGIVIFMIVSLVFLISRRPSRPVS